jgi:hypothetical protein
MTAYRHDGVMAKKKTTVYLDEDVLRAAKVYAARKDMRDSEVVEKALRRFLGFDLLESIWEKSRQEFGELTEEKAMDLAYAEVKAARRERAKRKSA